MLDQAAGFDVALDNASDTTAMLALQGPLAETILQAAADIDAAAVPFHGVVRGTLFNQIPALIARTGYTGEDGFELFVDNRHAAALWDALLALGAAHGLKPCGLGARDSLRSRHALRSTATRSATTLTPMKPNSAGSSNRPRARSSAAPGWPRSRPPVSRANWSASRWSGAASLVASIRFTASTANESAR